MSNDLSTSVGARLAEVVYQLLSLAFNERGIQPKLAWRLQPGW